MNQQLALQYRQMRLLARQREIADRGANVTATAIRDMIDDVLRARFGHGTQSPPRLVRQTVVSRNVAQIVFLDTNTIGRHKLNDILSEAGTCDAIRAHIHLDVKPFKRMPDGTFRAGFIIAYTNLTQLAAAGPTLAGPSPARTELPNMTDLEFIRNRPEGDYMLGLGVAREGDIWRSLLDLMHLIVLGSSGYGKSSFLRSIVYQCARMPQPVELYLVDLEDLSFTWAYNWPIVKDHSDNIEGAIKIGRTLFAEMERRKALYKSVPACPESWQEYRAATGVALPWIVAIFDEFSAIAKLAKRFAPNFEATIIQLSMRARKYGMTIVLAGQDIKADTLDTSSSNQFKTRIAFKCARREQSITVLREGGAERLSRPGNALIRIDDRDELIEMQAFWVPKSAVIGQSPDRPAAERVPAPARPDVPALSPSEAELVVYAYERNPGRVFSVNRIFQAFRSAGWSANAISRLAQRLERDGGLTSGKGNQGRQVTDRLYELAVQSRVQTAQATSSVRTWLAPEPA